VKPAAVVLLLALQLLGSLQIAQAADRPTVAQTPYASVDARQGVELPRDYGSHPQFRTEWWYATGWLTTQGGGSLGFQVTFFRTRLDLHGDNPSAFTPRQLIIGHAALSDPGRGRLWQDQRIERAGFGLADARADNTDVWVGPWSLVRAARDYQAHITGNEFSMNLRFTPTQMPMLNGADGVSRKGPDPAAASYYYSQPHLAVTGRITRAGRADEVTGEAWLDHEWSSEYLDPEAVGWDWIGINLRDGGALMAFEIRGSDGTARWSGGSLRSAGGQLQILGPEDVTFTPQRRWQSPRTGIAYPVVWQVRAGARQLTLEPLLDDQENDTRLSTGAIYWEGAVRALENGTDEGRGYLELTGYGEKLRLR